MKRTTSWLLWPRYPLLWLIRVYQFVLSPDHSPLWRHRFPGGYCRYVPSCSAYGYEVIKKNGLWYGGAKAIWRVLRCNPWSRGGADEP